MNRVRPTPNYDRLPAVDTGLPDTVCTAGWEEICSAILARMPERSGTLCVECYPGADSQEITTHLMACLQPARIVCSEEAMLSETQIRERFDRALTGDPVFGLMTHAHLEDFFDAEKVCEARLAPKEDDGLRIVIGVGASLLVMEPDLLLYVDMPRWELQKRQRQGLIGNIGLANLHARASEKYKRAYFLDWRVADRQKTAVMNRVDYVLDATQTSMPRMLAAGDYFGCLRDVVHRPFRLVPFFDPGPWGGCWMKEVFGLAEEGPNLAWCFDCVPEENSLRLRFDELFFELPAINLVLFFPRELLGEAVHGRFGTEFPIRFDLLDTMGGGNLSLQVHPLTEYIQEHFGMHYTQDESYYLLDAEPGAKIYLGLKNDVDPAAMIQDLRAASSACAFPAERHIHTVAAHRHDHFLIPAGTVHCSGAGTMVLEISATPYIFTFKMWDWNRSGLDGLPRPVHLQHALPNIQWNRRANWVEQHLVNTITSVGEGEGWREEHTGLHRREFIETRRHWFTSLVEHDTQGTLNVLNLVEGAEVIVESPDTLFPPFFLHYAETFIVPAAVGRFTVRPSPNAVGRCATIKAYVREGPVVARV